VLVSFLRYGGSESWEIFLERTSQLEKMMVYVPLCVCLWFLVKLNVVLRP